MSRPKLKCGKCKVCPICLERKEKRRLWSLNWSRANKDKRKAYSLLNKDKYAEKNKETQAIYYQEHKEELCEYSQAYYAKNKDAMRRKATHWTHRLNGKEAIENTRTKDMSTKYRFYQSFLKPILMLRDEKDKEEVKSLVNQLIQLRSLTKIQRQTLVLLRDGYSTVEVGKMLGTQQTTVNKNVNGHAVFKEDGTRIFYGGLAKKCLYTCKKFEAKSVHLKFLIEELKERSKEMLYSKAHMW